MKHIIMTRQFGVWYHTMPLSDEQLADALRVREGKFLFIVSVSYN